MPAAERQPYRGASVNEKTKCYRGLGYGRASWHLRTSTGSSGRPKMKKLTILSLLVAAAALVAGAALHRMVGARALYFAMAPTLLLYAFINWDLLAVALATVATLAFFRGRDGTAGVLLGLLLIFARFRRTGGVLGALGTAPGHVAVRPDEDGGIAAGQSGQVSDVDQAGDQGGVHTGSDQQRSWPAEACAINAGRRSAGGARRRQRRT